MLRSLGEAAFTGDGVKIAEVVIIEKSHAHIASTKTNDAAQNMNWIEWFVAAIKEEFAPERQTNPTPHQ
jgi:hypothetical protein